MALVIQADARCLPFRKETFDMIFTSAPWDDLGVLMEAKRELIRVTKRKGRMVMILPHLDNPELASMVLTNNDWTERQSFAVPRPSRVVGPKYHSLDPDFVARVLRKFAPKRVLDPFCGVGTVPSVARSLGIFAVGCDIDRAALEVAA